MSSHVTPGEQVKSDYAARLHDRYVKQRERLHNASLETAGRYDRSHLTIASGALAISVTFLDKISPSPLQWSVIIILTAWLSLLVSVIFQLMALGSSHNATREQIRILDEEFAFYFSGDDPAKNVRSGFAKQMNRYSSKTARRNCVASVSLVVGIVLIFAFSAVNFWFEGASMADQPEGRVPKEAERTGYERAKGSYIPETNELPPPPPPAREEKQSGESGAESASSEDN